MVDKRDKQGYDIVEKNIVLGKFWLTYIYTVVKHGSPGLEYSLKNC